MSRIAGLAVVPAVLVMIMAAGCGHDGDGAPCRPPAACALSSAELAAGPYWILRAGRTATLYYGMAPVALTGVTGPYATLGGALPALRALDVTGSVLVVDGRLHQVLGSVSVS